MGLFSVVCIMHWLEIIIFYLAETIIEILLVAAASASDDDTGAFADGLAVLDTILVLCDLHGGFLLSFSFKMCEIFFFMHQMTRFVSYISCCRRQW